MAKLEATIRKDGKVDVHVDLAEGDRCDEVADALAAVMEALGLEVSGRERKPRVPQAPTSTGIGSKKGR